MIGIKRQIRAPIKADVDYVLVQFTENDIYEIYPEDKLKKNRLGLFDAPFGPHNVFYPCRVIKVSSFKAELSKLKGDYEHLKKARKNREHDIESDESNESDTEDEEHEIEILTAMNKQQKKSIDKEQQQGLGEKDHQPKESRKKEQPQKFNKKEQPQEKKKQPQKQKERQKKKEEQRKKDTPKRKNQDEKQKKKTEQEEKQKKKDEKEKEKSVLLERNKSIMEEIAQFEEMSPCTHWDMDSLQTESPFSCDVVEGSSSLIFSCQEILQNNLSIAPAVHQQASAHSPPLSRPTSGLKFPRKHPLPTSNHTQSSDATKKNKLDENCSNCLALAKQLEDVQFKVLCLQQKLKELDGDYTCSNITNPRAGKVSKSVADLYQMVKLVPGSRIYAYQSQLDKAITRTTATARARCLLLAFYSPCELIEAQNLFGANNKKGLDKDIVNAVIGFSVAELGDSKVTRNAVQAALRKKITALMSGEKKKHRQE